MRMSASKHNQRTGSKKGLAIALLLAAATLAPFALRGAGQALKSNRNEVSDWLPASYPETQELKWFRQHFVADQFVIASWDGCHLGAGEAADDDPRIAKLKAAMLAATFKLPGAAEPSRCFAEVTTAREVLTELTSAPTNLEEELARERLRGGLIGPDSKQTCVVGTLTPTASAHLRESLSRPPLWRRLLNIAPPSPLNVALEAAGLDPAHVHLAGPPIDNISIDEEGERTLLRLAAGAGLLGLFLAWRALRSVKLTAIVFTCAIFSSMLSLSVVAASGQAMDAVLMSMPALVYVLALSGAVHLVNYYRHALDDGVDPREAPWHAVAHGWKPAAICSITTAVGLMSLCASDITPIRKFGFFSGIGTLLLQVVVFTLLPAVLTLLPERKAAPKQKLKADEAPKATWNFEPVARALVEHWRIGLAASFAVIAALSLGVTRTTTSIDLLKLFSSKAPLVQDYRWFEENLGCIVPMEVVVRIPQVLHQNLEGADVDASTAAAQLSFLERLEFASAVQGAIDRRFGAAGDGSVGKTMSAANYGPDIPPAVVGLNASSRRYVVSQALEEHRADLMRSGYLAVDQTNDDELWRVSVRVAAFKDLDYGVFVTQLHEAIEPVLAARRLSEQVLLSLNDNRDLGAGGATVLMANPQALETPIGSALRGFLAAKRVRVATVKSDSQAFPFDKLALVSKQVNGVLVDGEKFPNDAERFRAAGVPVVGSLADGHGDSAKSQANGAQIALTYTGGVPIVYKTQRALLDSLVQSTVWSFLTITPLMMLISRGVLPGLVVMIPNVLPVLVVFGGMGWLRVPVDIGSMMSASIALGVAVDDTIHFMAWFRQNLAALGDRPKAIIESFRQSAAPTIQSAIISGLGLSVFALSSFTPTARFGWLMLTILFAGVAAELLMLPCLLASPLGGVFDRRNPEPDAEVVTPEPPAIRATTPHSAKLASQAAKV